MKALEFASYGPPEVLRFKEVPVPEPGRGEVLIRIESDGVTYTGRGADTDIIIASAKAYMNALNRLLFVKNAAKK
jgi:D-arabinose 1-dehydrogenase-like Zn-dependent alcohol dehydrogenase